jgi:hypothetical protein
MQVKVTWRAFSCGKKVNVLASGMPKRAEQIAIKEPNATS